MKTTQGVEVGAFSPTMPLPKEDQNITDLWREWSDQLIMPLVQAAPDALNVTDSLASRGENCLSIDFEMLRECGQLDAIDVRIELIPEPNHALDAAVQTTRDLMTAWHYVKSRGVEHNDEIRVTNLCSGARELIGRIGYTPVQDTVPGAGVFKRVKRRTEVVYATELIAKARMAKRRAVGGLTIMSAGIHVGSLDNGLPVDLRTVSRSMPAQASYSLDRTFKAVTRSEAFKKITDN